MEFYYDIDLNFCEFYINYYEWDKLDKIDHFFKLPIIKVNDINVFLLNYVRINIDYKNAIISDGINALAIEQVDGIVRYISSLSYQDETRICEIVFNMEESNIDFKIVSPREKMLELRGINKIKKVLINKINENDLYFLKYLYYEITNKDSNSIDKIKKYLINDINNNFDNKYLKIYDNIYN